MNRPHERNVGLLLEESVAESAIRNRSQSRQTDNPVSSATEAEKSAVGPLSVAPRTEKDDNYPVIVARLNPCWRIIECRDRIQWILQRRKGQSSGRPEWRGRCYCRTRDGLLTCIRENCGPVDAEAIAAIESLPQRTGGSP